MSPSPASTAQDSPKQTALDATTTRSQTRYSPSVHSSFPKRSSSLRKPTSLKPHQRTVTFKEDVPKESEEAVDLDGREQSLQNPSPLSPLSTAVPQYNHTRSSSSTSTDSASSTATIKPSYSPRTSPASTLQTLQPRTYIPPPKPKPSHSTPTRPTPTNRSVSTPDTTPTKPLEYLQPRTYIPPNGWNPTWRPLTAPPADYTAHTPPAPHQQREKRPSYPPRTSSLPFPPSALAGLKSPDTSSRPISTTSMLVPVKMSLSREEVDIATREMTHEEDMAAFAVLLAELPDMQREAEGLRRRLDAQGVAVGKVGDELEKLMGVGRGLLEEVEGWLRKG